MDVRAALTTLAATLALAACSAAPQQAGPLPAASPTPPAPTEEAPAVTKEPAAAHPAPGPATSAAQSAAKAAEVATFGAGCYWCTEAVLEQVPGVLDVRSGFMGGHVANPSYEEACSGTTGHAEVVQVTFDPATVSYETLLDWFWRLHDPTTLDRQGADVGTQYRSVVFWHDDAQRAAAERSKKTAQESFADPIVTEIAKAGPFYEAPPYHQDYYRQNASQGYCRAVIAPKLGKLGLKK
jgi:peptide-methionine (S)-S-oxide reductase